MQPLTGPATIVADSGATYEGYAEVRFHTVSDILIGVGTFHCTDTLSLMNDESALTLRCTRFNYRVKISSIDANGPAHIKTSGEPFYAPF